MAALIARLHRTARFRKALRRAAGDYDLWLTLLAAVLICALAVWRFRYAHMTDSCFLLYAAHEVAMWFWALFT